MTRIVGVSAREAGPLVKLAYFFTRRQIARLTGRETERMIEPLEMYAHVPGLLRGYARLEQATAKLSQRLQTGLRRCCSIPPLRASTMKSDGTGSRA